MKCPKCSAPMQKVDFQETQLDRCTQCGGLWFDALELDDLRQTPGSEQVDTGTRRIGRQLNAVQHLHCPKCSAAMLRMVDARQPHVWFEECSVCGGVFLDAGELRDLKVSSLLDRIRDLLTPERR